MKRKVIATLVAAAFGLSASQAVLAECPLDGATPFNAGPVNPLNGFTEYVEDSTGLQLELCRQGDGATGLCFFDPPVAGNLFSQQIGFGAEAFWWLAEASIRQGGLDALVVMAAEAAFATENPAPGEQFPFTRLRIRLDLPVPGTYVVTHPYGQHTYIVPEVGVGDELRESFDIQFQPGVNGQQGRVGPWLRSIQDPNNPGDTPIPAGFVGDGTPRIASGSPCSTNFFKVEAISPDGGVTPPPVIDPNDSDGDLSTSSFTTDLFTVFGKVWDGKYNTPVVADRTTYDRPAADGQVDAFATSTANHAPAASTVSVSGGANLPAGELALAGPDAAGRFSRSELLANAGTLPGHVALTASRADAATDPTTLLRHLTDVVRVSKAEYNVDTGLLSVMATSSDVAANPVLTVQEYGRTVGPSGVGIATAAPPAAVTVASTKGGSATAPVTVVAAGVAANLPPFATGDDAITNEDTAVTIPVLANDGDPDGDPITVLDVINAQNGSVANNGTSVTFTPAPNFFGPASFEYRVTDNRPGGVSGYALVTVNVLPVNDAPVAVNDAASTQEDAAVTIAGAFLASNDTDVENDNLTVTAVGNAVNGLVTLNGGDVTFTPATNFSGQASFQYTVSDGNGGNAVGTVAVTVTPLNDPPVAQNDFATTPFQTAVTINVLTNDTDPEGTALTVDSVGTASNGTVTNNGTSITYTPATGFSGSDSFTYVARDAAGALSNTATVQVTVAANAQLVDLDINRLTVTSSVRRARNQAVGITMRVQNGGTVNGARPATVTGTMNGVEIYRQTLQVSDPVGGGTTNVTFPSFTPTATGTINWRAEIFDDNPDVDVATAATTVQ